MAITQQAVGSSNGSGTSVSFAVNVGSGTDRYLIVAVNDQGSGGSSAVTGVTYNSVSMTKVLGPTKFGPTPNNADFLTTWVLHNPSSGSNNVVITNSASTATFNNYFVMNGAIQSSTVNASDAFEGDVATSSHSRSVTTTVDGCGIVHNVGNQWNSNVWSVGTRVVDNGGMGEAKCNPFPQTTQGSYTFTWTITSAASGTKWASHIVAVEPAGAASQIASINGVAQANIASMNGVTLANISSVNGVSNV